MFDSLLWYMLSPRAFPGHVLGVGLIASLVQQKVDIKSIVLNSLLGFVISFSLWMIIPNNISTIIACAVSIHLYEKLTGPRIEIQENAVLVADEDFTEIIEKTTQTPSSSIIGDDNVEKKVLQTDLQYIIYTSSIWGSQKDKTGAIDINEVTGLGEGWDSNVSQLVQSKGGKASQCFHLMIGDKTVVTFIAADNETRNNWLKVFMNLFGGKYEESLTKWVESLMTKCGVNEDARELRFDDAISVLQKADRPTDKNYVREYFNNNGIKAGKGEVTLPRGQFSKFLELAGRRPTIEDIFDRIKDNKGGEFVVSLQRLKSFMLEDQRENVSNTHCKEWIRMYEKVIPPFSFSPIGFTTFMISEEQTIFNRDHKEIFQSMDEPLSHYFIATSHNTYLMKDQLRGKSSVEAYVNAFKRGCKCVELDCWDGPNNEPIIYHGHTLTSKILFKDVVKGINEYAFCVSDYPVILSFENHCSVEQQKVMAKHLIEIMGDKLYTDQPPEDETRLPSPEQLKGYIICKAKKLKKDEDDEEDIDDEFSDVEEEDIDSFVDEENGEKDAEKEEGKEITRKRSSSKTSTLKRLIQEKKQSGTKDKVPKIAQELSDLVAYCQAVHFKSFEHSKQNAKPCQMSSFAEKKAVKFCKENCPALINYNKRQLSRIYPAGARVDSSNYDPQPMWNNGCQLVALNYQTSDKPMQINQGHFQVNGGCGYVLKPAFLRQDNITFDPRGPFDSNRSKSLTLRILSANQLTYSKESKTRKDRKLLVEVDISGVEDDTQKFKTKITKNNGFNPIWDEAFGIKLYCPELAMVQFVVREETDMIASLGMDPVLGQYALPFSSIEQGYRRVPLHTKAFEPLPYSSLFVHVEIQDM